MAGASTASHEPIVDPMPIDLSDASSLVPPGGDTAVPCRHVEPPDQLDDDGACDERDGGHENAFCVNDHGQSLDEAFHEPPTWDPHLQDYSGDFEGVDHGAAHHDIDEAVDEDANMHGASTSGDGHGERRVRRRLNNKTPAHATIYGVAKLLTRREANEQRDKRATKRRRVAADSRNVVAQAWTLLEARMRPSGGSHCMLEEPIAGSSGIQRGDGPGLPGASGGVEDIPEAGPDLHASHDIRKAVNLNVVYCNVCGAWTSGIRGRKLVEPCEGRCKHPTSLRLLQVGVYPAAGAKLPPQLRQPGARGTRRPRW